MHKIMGRRGLFLYLENHYKIHNIHTLNKSINPFKIDTKYIQHTYDLHIGVWMIFKIHGPLMQAIYMVISFKNPTWTMLLLVGKMDAAMLPFRN